MKKIVMIVGLGLMIPMFGARPVLQYGDTDPLTGKVLGTQTPPALPPRTNTPPALPPRPQTPPPLPPRRNVPKTQSQTPPALPPRNKRPTVNNLPIEQLPPALPPRTQLPPALPPRPDTPPTLPPRDHAPTLPPRDHGPRPKPGSLPFGDEDLQAAAKALKNKPVDVKPKSDLELALDKKFGNAKGQNDDTDEEWED